MSAALPASGARAAMAAMMVMIFFMNADVDINVYRNSIQMQGQFLVCKKINQADGIPTGLQRSGPGVLHAPGPPGMTQKLRSTLKPTTQSLPTVRLPAGLTMYWTSGLKYAHLVNWTL